MERILQGPNRILLYIPDPKFLKKRRRRKRRRGRKKGRKKEKERKEMLS